MIHEFLSDPNWLNPQIDYLLWVQNLRTHLGPVFENLFLHITMFGEILIPTLVISIIYWCIDSEAGLYLFGLNSCGILFMQLFKTSACIYRPWILSDKIKPVASALAMAHGYSFPSGHCMISATSWGGIAFLLRKRKFIATLIVLLILTIAFSRTYLGVHTPQDVLIGLLSGLVFVFVMHYILKWCKKNKNRYLYLLAIFDMTILGTLLYVILKSYPLDYVNGKLLVNPYHARYVAVLFCGWVMGLVNGVLLCKRFFPFDAKSGSIKTRVIRGIVGASVFYSIFYPVNNYFIIHESHFRVALPSMFALGFFVTAIYPLIFSNVENFISKKQMNNVKSV